MPSEQRAETFSGQIMVAARIIDYLSSGLYHTAAACLKELINNSFDADARHVELYIKPDADRIIIEDDGEGISRTEFERHFKRIAESHKREGDDHTKSGRPKIGKIGIGFIAANELCDRVEIFSTKQGSRELLHVSINFAELRKNPEQRRKGSGDFVKGDYEGEVSETAEVEAHYTRVFLQEIKGEAKDVLASALSARQGSTPLTLYGLNVSSTEGVDIALLGEHGIINFTEIGGIAADSAGRVAAVEYNKNAVLLLQKKFPGLKIYERAFQELVRGVGLTRYPEREDEQFCRARVVNLDLNVTLRVNVEGGRHCFSNFNLDQKTWGDACEGAAARLVSLPNVAR
jgi:hypothetical protein